MAHIDREVILGSEAQESVKKVRKIVSRPIQYRRREGTLKADQIMLLAAQWGISPNKVIDRLVDLYIEATFGEGMELIKQYETDGFFTYTGSGQQVPNTDNIGD